MKTLKRLFFFIATIFLLMACSKTDQPELSLSGKSGGNLMNKPVVCGNVFIVEPRGEGLDDTKNLRKAFDNALAEPPESRPIVKLVEGKYNIGFLEVREFYGSFVGAGIGNTVITAMTGLRCDSVRKLDLGHVLIKFVGGDVYVGEMTVQTPKATVCSTGGGLKALMQFADFNSQYTSMQSYINVSINNVYFRGPWAGAYTSNYGVLATHDYDKANNLKNRSHIDITVTNCSFNGFNVGVMIPFIKEGVLNIGEKNNGNIFNWCYEGVLFRDDINVKISVVDNIFNLQNDGWADGVDIWNAKPASGGVDDKQTKSTLCIIEGNEFNLIGISIALYLHDHRMVTDPEKLPMLMQIKNNKINHLNEKSWGGEMIEGVNTVIRNNQFKGKGTCGFYADALNGVNVWSDNCLFLGNNFSNVDYSKCSIWLGPFTRNFTIIGGDNKDRVQDEGYNNVITGMNVSTSSDPVGQTIVDNLRLMKEAINNMDEN